MMSGVSVLIIHSAGLEKSRAELNNSHFKVEEREASPY